MSDCILRAEGLRKEYFRKSRDAARYFDAVSGVDLSLRSGEVVALKGRSGSGKTTLLNMLAGLLTPTGGTVTLDGQDLYSLPDSELSRLRNGRIGMVPQGQAALHSLSVAENVKLPWRLYRDGDGGHPRALELLGEMGIAELADGYPAELSGGELRRMAIARALVCEPAVVIADEPTADLDDENTRTVLEALRRAADGGASVLVATHEQLAGAFADRILRMDAGTLC